MEVEEDLSGGQHEMEHCQIGEGGTRGREVGEGESGVGRSCRAWNRRGGGGGITFMGSLQELD